jgi:catechol 2,3-dioxygenase-like lactoylglutathione lyase family enzyme
MVTGFHHTSFTVSNVVEAERFFVENFGLRRIGGGDYDFDYIRRTVAIPDAVLGISVLALPKRENADAEHLIELIEYRKSGGAPTDTATNRPGNAHLCFEVDNIHGEYTRLRERGVRFKSAPNEVTWGINAGAWSVYFNGPDDIALELLQRAKKTAG